MKIKEIVQSVLYRSIQILMLVQILLGILWMVGNFGAFQDFPETRELCEIGETFVTDEYVGILYPCIVSLTRGMSRLIPVPYYCLIYLLQLGFCFGVLWKLTEGMSQRIWCILWIMTMPAVAQLNLAVLPQAPAAFMLLLCFLYSFGGDWGKGAVCWLLGGLLLPENFLLGGGVYLISLLIRMARERRFDNGNAEKRETGKRNALRGVLFALVVCILGGAAASAFFEVHSRGRMARTPASMAMYRCVWPYFSFYQFFWGEEIKDVFTEEDLVAISQNQEKVLEEFGPKIEETYGMKKAQSIYWEMSGVSLRIGAGRIVKETAADLFSYVFSPFVVVWNLRGVGVSFSGWNYNIMLRNTPTLTKYYVHYSGSALAVLLFLILANCLLNGRKKGSVAWKKGVNTVGFGVLAVAAALWYTLTAAGMQDYKNVILIHAFWGFVVFWILICYTHKKG